MIRESFEPLRLPGYRAWLAGRTVNALGNAAAPIALAFAVLDLTGSATDLGIVVGVRMVVNVVFLLFGGALADRLPKHLLMVGAAVAAAVTQGIVAALVLTGTATIPLLLLFGGINGMVAALSMPASAAIIPQLVRPELRQKANALGRLFLNAAMIIGAPVGAAVVAGVGPGWGIAADAATFLLSALLFSLIRLPKKETAPVPAGATLEALDVAEAAAEKTVAPPARSSILTDLRTGWTEFSSRTWLWVVVAGFCVVNGSLAGGLMVLGPLVADQTIGRQAWGLVLAAETAGMIIGGLIALRLKLRRLLLVGVICTAGEALPMFILGVRPQIFLLIFAGFVAGVTLEQFGVAWETTMQEHVPEDKLARVYSYDMVGSWVAMPIGQVAVGPIAERAGLEPTLIGLSVLVLLAVAGMLSSRDVRHLRHELPSREVKESVA